MSAAALLLGAVLLAGLLPPTPSPPPATLRVGREAPPLLATGLDGKMLGPVALRGRPVLVNVFATSCARCRDEIPVIVASYARHHARVTFLGVVEREPLADLKAFVRRMRIPYAVGVDGGAMAATFGAGPIPHSVFIDGHGIVRTIRNEPLSHTQLERNLALIAGG